MFPDFHPKGSRPVVGNPVRSVLMHSEVGYVVREGFMAWRLQQIPGFVIERVNGTIGFLTEGEAEVLPYGISELI